MVLITALVILLVLYLILSTSNPSLRLFNKNNESIRKVSSLTTSNPSAESMSHFVGSDPFEEWAECDEESAPQLIGYHVHALFDGTDRDSIAEAYSAYHLFVGHMDPSMEQCEHAHSTPASWQLEVCYFPTTWTESDFPIASNFIFQTSNYGFYIPPQHLQQSVAFWMQHHADIAGEVAFDYVFHTVSGCQRNDHSKWLLESGGYDDSKIVLDNLVCCHNGPSLCTCSMVQYELDGGGCLGLLSLSLSLSVALTLTPSHPHPSTLCRRSVKVYNLRTSRRSHLWSRTARISMPERAGMWGRGEK